MKNEKRNRLERIAKREGEIQDALSDIRELFTEYPCVTELMWLFLDCINNHIGVVHGRIPDNGITLSKGDIFALSSDCHTFSTLILSTIKIQEASSEILYQKMCIEMKEQKLNK